MLDAEHLERLNILRDLAGLSILPMLIHFPAMSESVDARTFFFVVDPEALVRIGVGEGAAASALAAPSLPFSRIFFAVRKQMFTLSFSLSIKPVSSVDCTVGPGHGAEAVALAVVPLALVLLAVSPVVFRVRQDPHPLILASEPASLVLLAVGPREGSVALEHSPLELSLELHLLPIQRSIPVEEVVFPGAVIEISVGPE